MLNLFLKKSATGHLLQPGKASSGESGTLTQPQTLLPTISPVSKMYWGKGSTNQEMFQFGIHSMRGIPPLILPRGPEIKGQMAQKPKRKLNTPRKKVGDIQRSTAKH